VTSPPSQTAGGSGRKAAKKASKRSPLGQSEGGSETSSDDEPFSDRGRGTHTHARTMRYALRSQSELTVPYLEFHRASSYGDRRSENGLGDPGESTPPPPRIGSRRAPRNSLSLPLPVMVISFAHKTVVVVTLARARRLFLPGASRAVISPAAHKSEV
jgi:hypothetical protein